MIKQHWRLTCTAVVSEGVWTETYDSETVGGDPEFARGFASGVLYAKGIGPKQISFKLEVESDGAWSEWYDTAKL